MGVARQPGEPGGRRRARRPRRPRRRGRVARRRRRRRRAGRPAPAGRPAAPDGPRRRTARAAGRPVPPDGPRPPEQPGGADEAGNGMARLRAAAVDRLPREPPVPGWLAAGRGLVVAAAAGRPADLRGCSGWPARSALVVLPCVAALLLTALLQPLTARLRRAGMPVAGRDVVHGPGRDRGPGRARRSWPSTGSPPTIRRLQTEVKHTAHEVQTSLAGPPFHLSSARLEQYYDELVHFLSAAPVADRGHGAHRREDLPGAAGRPDPDDLRHVLPAQGR